MRPAEACELWEASKGGLAKTILTAAGCLLLVAALCLSGTWPAAQARSCPEAADFRPCTCDIQGVNCAGANSTAVLKRAFATDGPKEHAALWIQKSGVESFPRDVLGHFVFREIHVELNANLTYFDIASLNKSRPFVTKLSLYGNALRTFQFAGVSGFPKLRELNLGRNQLEVIPTHALRSPRLQVLVLSDNPIHAVGAYAFADLPQLRTLHLTGTRIVRLGDHALSIPSRSPELKVLVSGGNVTSVSVLAFSSADPKVISLKDNNLTELPRPVFFPILERLGRRSSGTLLVSGNPFSCAGCSFRWLVSMKNVLLSRRLLSGFVCADGTSLARLTFQKIGC